MYVLLEHLEAYSSAEVCLKFPEGIIPALSAPDNNHVGVRAFLGGLVALTRQRAVKEGGS